VILCADKAFEPGGLVSAGKKACGVLLGSQILAADCAGGVPAELTADIYNYATGQSSKQGSVEAVAGGCQFSTASTNVTVTVSAGDAGGPLDEPGSVIVIADFVPPTTASGTQIGARCSQAGCIRLGLRTDGNYTIRERGDQDLLQGNFNQDQVPAPKLKLGEVNRVVLYVKGKKVQAFINGRTIAVGPTALPDQPGQVLFTVDNHDAKHPVIEKLLRLYVFQAG
jgi:hypothetical protein